MKKRKRAPGGGRKARSGPTSNFTFRIPDDLRRELEEEATDNATVSERVLWHLRRSIARKHEEERDPALQKLLLLIGMLAEEITGGELMADEFFRSKIRHEWRTDLHKFRAFKFAVKKLLDTLEEPPDSMTEQERERLAKESLEKWGGPPEFNRLFIEAQKSPEAMGAWVFNNFWTRLSKSHLPFTKEEQEAMVEFPDLGQKMKREYYDFRKVRSALELKPPKEDVMAAVKRIMKERNLDPETEPPPDDIKKAIQLIVDRAQARTEAADKLPAGDALKLLESDSLPTLDEALKLIKSEKRKDKRK
jgi:hypothetical protein